MAETEPTMRDEMLKLLDLSQVGQYCVDDFQLGEYSAKVSSNFGEDRLGQRKWYNVWRGDEYLGERLSLIDAMVFIFKDIKERIK